MPKFKISIPDPADVARDLDLDRHVDVVGARDVLYAARATLSRAQHRADEARDLATAAREAVMVGAARPDDFERALAESTTTTMLLVDYRRAVEDADAALQAARRIGRADVLRLVEERKLELEKLRLDQVQPVLDALERARHAIGIAYQRAVQSGAPPNRHGAKADSDVAVRV